jgi:acetyltransferase-like isoleucine patch superfamily enzyme
VIGDWAMVTDAEPGIADVETPVRAQPVGVRPVRIGEGARIGAHAALLAGAQVDAGGVVGSYAVLSAEPALTPSPR